MPYDDLLEILENEEGFFNHNNFSIEERTKDNVILKALITKNSTNPYGIAHGGFIFGLGDTVMGMLARKDGRNAVTLNANITYLKPGTGEYLIAKGEIIKQGKSTCYLRANIYNDEDKLIATMDSNYFYIN